MTRFLIFNCMYLFLELTLLFLEAYEVQSWLGFSFLLVYRKIPKISPGAYIFQRPFLRGLFLEGPMFGGAYVRREICVSNSIVLACSGKEIYHFCFVLEGKFQVQAPRGVYIQRGDLTEGFFITGLGGLYLEGLVHGGAYFRNFTVYLLLHVFTILLFLLFLELLWGTIKHFYGNYAILLLLLLVLSLLLLFFTRSTST